MIIVQLEITGRYFAPDTGAAAHPGVGPPEERVAEPPFTLEQLWHTSRERLENVNVSKITKSGRKKKKELIFCPFFQIHLSHLWGCFMGLLHPLSKII